MKRVNYHLTDLQIKKLKQLSDNADKSVQTGDLYLQRFLLRSFLLPVTVPRALGYIKVKPQFPDLSYYNSL